MFFLCFHCSNRLTRLQALLFVIHLNKLMSWLGILSSWKPFSVQQRHHLNKRTNSMWSIYWALLISIFEELCFITSCVWAYYYYYYYLADPFPAYWYKLIILRWRAVKRQSINAFPVIALSQVFIFFNPGSIGLHRKVKYIYMKSEDSEVFVQLVSYN